MKYGYVLVMIGLLFQMRGIRIRFHVNPVLIYKIGSHLFVHNHKDNRHNTPYLHLSLIHI